MAEHDLNRPDTQHEPRDTHEAPGLFERYQAQQQAWLAQADALARLRDDVRTAAEREAMEIVATARRDIRQVIAEARRELLVLTAQLHATLGATTDAPAPPHALPPAESDHEGLLAAHEIGAPPEVSSGAGLAAFERARAGIDALAEEASDFDVPVRTAHPAEPPQPPAAVPHASRLLEQREGSVRGVPWRPHADLVPSVTSSSQAVDSNQRLKVAAGVGALVILLMAALWLWPSSETEPSIVSSGMASDATAADAVESAQGAAPIAAAAERVETSPAVDPAAPAVSRAGSDLSIALTIRRPAWIRATVDGRREVGRTYEAGETRRIDAARSVSLRVGDAGAVLLSVNGSTPEVLGADGAVVEPHFGEEPVTAPTSSAETPAPSPAAAATPSTTAAAPLPAQPRPQPDPAAVAAEVDALESSSIWVPETNVVAAGQQWIDAYQRQDEKAMAAITPGTPNVMDERRPDQRFPVEAEGIKRQLETLGIEFTGDSAVFTARMIEQRTDGFSSQQHVSRVAQIWARRDGRWQLTDVRITNEELEARR